MRQRLVDRIAIESDLAAARRRAGDLMPFSPAWDASMAWVEDLERQLWPLDQASQSVRANRAVMRFDFVTNPDRMGATLGKPRQQVT